MELGIYSFGGVQKTRRPECWARRRSRCATWSSRRSPAHVPHPRARSAGRRALAVAGDSDEARALVAGRAFQPGTEIFNGSHTAPQMQSLLSAADHPAHA